ncbi:MAG TPA: type 1 glutamine amidotransferase [Terriglobales bacterium]|jgi:GMP synthase-like glutamine amidotransferase
MQPVAIFRHWPTEGPGYFATYLESADIPWRLVALDEGEAVPLRAGDFSGIAFMGGPMSVNDDLPWIAPVLDLIRSAVAADVPVLGHCLGGQLMAKALGGSVRCNPVKEIGWGEVEVKDNSTAREWLGPDVTRFEAFHWHGETFTIPPGAVHVMSNRTCENQGFVLGKHLAMQCHVEMTRDLITSWCESGAGEIAASTSPAVQKPDQILTGMDARITSLRAIAMRLYDQWTRNLKRT